MSQVTLVGRSSSHFTRTARLFALELGVPHDFRPVYDITSVDLENYAGNPALKVPTLLDEDGPLFGTENICRELAARSGRSGVFLRGQVPGRLVANLEELTLHVMQSEVSVIMTRAMGQSTPPAKLMRSLENALAVLDEHVDALLAALPRERSLTFVEVALFCGVTHMPFRQVLSTDRYERLTHFCNAFGQRESARATEYRFDAPPQPAA